MWQRFTERARRAVFFAQEEAARLGENYVGTEHLLLGLTRESDSVAATVLDQLDIPLGKIRANIERQVRRGHDNLGQDMQLTPRAKRVIDLAYEEARRLDNNFIGTEHLLLGLIREGEGLAASVLSARGAELDRTRAAIVQMQAGGAATAAPTLAAEPRWQHRDLAVELDRLAALAGGHAELQPRIKAAREQLDALAIEVEALARSIDSAPMEAPHQAAEGEPPPAREQSPHGGIWGHFTERARRAVFFAQEEAARRGVHQVEPEHLLLGLLRDECVPVDVLQHLGVEPSAVLHGLEQHLSRGSGEPEAEMQLTAPARRVIDRAFEESRRLGSAVIGCQHLLLGILGETEGVTARLFAGLGVDLETAREAVARGQ